MPLVKSTATMEAMQIEKYKDTEQKVVVIGSIEEHEAHQNTPVSTTSEQVLFTANVYIWVRLSFCVSLIGNFGNLRHQT